MGRGELAIPYLPPAIEEVIVNTAEAVSALRDIAAAAAEASGAVGALQEALDALHGKTVDIGVDTSAFQGAVAGVNDLSGAEFNLAEASARLTDAQKQLMDETSRVVTVDEMTAAYQKALIVNAELNRSAVETAHALSDAWAVAMAMNEGMDTMAARMGRAGSAASAAGKAAAGAAQGWTILGVAAGTVVHWVVAAGAEFLAVAIPALVAGGAAALVAAQGFTDAQTHLTAMYAATEATANIFHQTIGNLLGMKSVLQQAQNAADPKIFALLGAGINIAKASAGGFVQEGTQVINVLDNFAAKVTADMQGAFGSQLHGLLSGGVKDLTEFGQVLGNVGHAVLNLAGDMPGLAGVLLSLLSGVSRLVEWFTTLPGFIITAAMGLEEFWRWGGLAASMITRLFSVVANIGPAIAGAFGAVAGTAQKLVQAVVGGVGLLVGNVGRATIAFGQMEIAAGMAGGEIDALGAEMIAAGGAAVAAGVEIEGLGAAIATVAAEITPLQALLALVAAAGFVFLAVKAVAAGEALSKWASGAEQAVQKASDLQVIPTIANEMANAASHYASAQQQVINVMHSTSGAASDVASRYGMLDQSYRTASEGATQAAGVQRYLNTAMQNTLQGAGALEKTYGTTFVGALALAQAAGVKLADGITGTGQAAIDAKIKIANYVAGMNAMGETTSTVGHDVTLLGISSALAGTHIQQLQQAFSGFVDNMTGGTSNLAALDQAVSHLSGNLSSFTGRAAQNWQNFDSALTGSASQLVQWFQLAGTEGAVKGAQFTHAMQDITAQFVQFAAKTPAARAELVGFANAAGLSAKNFPDLVHQLEAAGASSKGLAGIVQQVTAAMSNMNEVAKALGSSIGSDIVAAMNNARVAGSGLTSAAEALQSAWQSEHSVNNGVISAFQQTYQALNNVYHNTTLARSAVDALAQQMGMSQGQIAQLNGMLGQLSGQAAGAAGQVHGLAAAINGLQSKTVDVVVNTYYNSIGLGNRGGHTGTGPMGAAGGIQNAPTGPLWVGEHGPELLFMNGGESVLSHGDSQRFMSSPSGYGGGGGSDGQPMQINLTATLHHTTQVDGQTLMEAQQPYVLRYNVRNGNPGSGTMAPRTAG